MKDRKISLREAVKRAKALLPVMDEYHSHDEPWENTATGEILDEDIVIWALEEFIENHTW